MNWVISCLLMFCYASTTPTSLLHLNTQTHTPSLPLYVLRVSGKIKIVDILACGFLDDLLEVRIVSTRN